MNKSSTVGALKESINGLSRLASALEADLQAESDLMPPMKTWMVDGIVLIRAANPSLFATSSDWRIADLWREFSEKSAARWLHVSPENIRSFVSSL